MSDPIIHFLDRIGHLEILESFFLYMKCYKTQLNFQHLKFTSGAKNYVSPFLAILDPFPPFAYCLNALAINV